MLSVNKIFALLLITVAAVEYALISGKKALLSEPPESWLEMLSSASLISLATLALIAFLARRSLAAVFTNRSQLLIGWLVFASCGVVFLSLGALDSMVEAGITDALRVGLLSLLVSGSICFWVIKPSVQPAAIQEQDSAILSLHWTGLWVYLAILSLLAGTGSVHRQSIESEFEQELMANEHARLGVMEKIVMTELSHTSMDLLLLANRDHTRALGQGDQSAAAGVAHDFSQRLLLQTEIRWIRFIGSDGREQIRIQRHSGKIEQARPEALEDHSRSDAFQRIRQAGGFVRFQVHTGGSRQQKPGARQNLVEITAPIEDDAGEFFGALSLLYEMPDLNEAWENAQGQPRGSIVLADHTGTVLGTPGVKHITDVFGAQWEDIQMRGFGGINTEESAAFYRRLDPAAGDNTHLTGHPHWWLLSVFDQDQLAAHSLTHLKPYFLMYALTALLIALPIALSARVWRLTQMTKNHLEQKAYFDQLTGLANRELFHTRLTGEQQRAQRGDQEGSLIYLDLDHFKAINDGLGHGAGDRVLTTIARRLESCVRPYDTVARLGGDEFAVILSAPIKTGEVADVAERILEQIALPIDYCGHHCKVGASLGIARFSSQEESPEDSHRPSGPENVRG